MVISCKHDDESWWIMMNHDASWWFIGFGEGFNHNYSRMKPTVMGISWHHVSKLYLDGELTSNLWPCYAMLGKWFNFREHRGHRRSSVCWDGKQNGTNAKPPTSHCWNTSRKSGWQSHKSSGDCGHMIFVANMFYVNVWPYICFDPTNKYVFKQFKAPYHLHV